MAKSNRSTFAKSRNRSAKIDRPFDAAVLHRARQIAEQYRVIIRHEDGEYYGQSLELPGAMNDGKTPAECLDNTIDIRHHDHCDDARARRDSSITRVG